MGLFETKSIFNEETLKELKKYIMTPRQKVPIIFLIIVSAFMLMFSIFYLSMGYTAAFAIATLLFILEYFYVMNRNVNTVFRRMQESTNATEYEYTTTFNADALIGVNHTTNAIANILYDNFQRFIETKNYYILFTRADKYVLINREEIDQAGKREDFLAFLKNKCQNVKW